MNHQPIQHADFASDGSLEVTNVWSTFQGEGPHAGRPAVFVRLKGCNLQCPLCDTEYSTGRRYFVKELSDQIKLLAGEGRRLVVFTGGEPFRQNIGSIIHYLTVIGFEVQIETNGTMDWQFQLDRTLDRLTVVCSPKAPKVCDSMWKHITALKYVIRDGEVDPADGLPFTTLGQKCRVCKPRNDFKGEIYIQPCDEGDERANKRHLKAAMMICERFGYRLSVQLHKILGVE